MAITLGELNTWTPTMGKRKEIFFYDCARFSCCMVTLYAWSPNIDIKIQHVDVVLKCICNIMRCLAKQLNDTHHYCSIN